jgi:hypothetical protein
VKARNFMARHFIISSSNYSSYSEAVEGDYVMEDKAGRIRRGMSFAAWWCGVVRTNSD